MRLLLILLYILNHTIHTSTEITVYYTIHNSILNPTLYISIDRTVYFK